MGSLVADLSKKKADSVEADTKLNMGADAKPKSTLDLENISCFGFSVYRPGRVTDTGAASRK